MDLIFIVSAYRARKYNFLFLINQIFWYILIEYFLAFRPNSSFFCCCYYHFGKWGHFIFLFQKNENKDFFSNKKTKAFMYENNMCVIEMENLFKKYNCFWMYKIHIFKNSNKIFIISCSFLNFFDNNLNVFSVYSGS